MERYGSITTPVSIPRFIIGGMLVGGVAVVAMAFLNYGLLAGKLEDFVQDRPGDLPLCEADVVLVEYPPFSDKSVPKELLRNAALNIVIAPANRTWKDTDQLLFEKTEKLAGRTPVTLCLNCARRDVVQSFTGLMPPYTRMRRLGYQISQFGFTAVK